MARALRDVNRVPTAIAVDSATGTTPTPLEVDSSTGELLTKSSATANDKFGVNDIEVASATVTYIGMEDDAGVWYLKKIDTSSGNVFSHATETNNAGTSDYSTAWTNRAALTYGDYSAAF